MKKIFFLAILIVASAMTYAQELENVNTIIRPISTIFKTEYGIIVYYPSSKIDVSSIFVPNSWFVPLNVRDEGSEIPEIVAKLQHIHNNFNSPYFRALYIDNQVKELHIHLTKKRINASTDYLPRSLREMDLESYFKDQENKDYIEIK